MEQNNDIMLFELQEDAGDEERVKLNLIQLAAQQGTLKRTETDKEIRFQGLITIDSNLVTENELKQGGKINAKI